MIADRQVPSKRLDHGLSTDENGVPKLHVSGCFNTTLGATWRSLPTDLHRVRIVTRRIITVEHALSSPILRKQFQQLFPATSGLQPGREILFPAGSGRVSRRPKVAATCLTAMSLALPDGELGIAVLQDNRYYVWT